MRIRMLKTVSGAPNGGRTMLFHAGTEYTLGATERENELVGVFFREGWAEEVKSAPPPPAQVTTETAPAPTQRAPEKAPDAPPQHPQHQHHGGKSKAR